MSRRRRVDPAVLRERSRTSRRELLEALRTLPSASEATIEERKRALALADLADALYRLDLVTRRRKPTKIGADMSNTDLPSELGSYSDGVTDDAAYHPELIGCGLDALGVSGGIQHLSVAGGLGDLAVAGIPSYLFTRKGLSNPVVRRRIAESIEAMTPKMKRRVLSRLRSAVAVARVSGQVRSAYPSVSGIGWSGITVAGSRGGGCPYANVAGPLTP